LKILQVISSLDPVGGGVVEGLIQQNCELVKAGHEVHTLSLDHVIADLDDRLPANSVSFAGPAYLGYFYAPRLAPWLRQHASAYDVIVTHGLWQYHGWCVQRVARALRKPYVVFLHGMLDPYFGRRYPLKHLKKLLYWTWGEHRVLSNARLLLFTTSEELQLARRSFRQYTVRERLVGFGIHRRDPIYANAKASFFDSFPALKGKRILLFLSRIDPKKGCDMLVKAFAKVAATDAALHLVMAGPDTAGWQKTLMAEACALRVGDRISFTGMLMKDVKWGAYDAADAFVLPSHQENFGIVVAEALASGLPVLTTNKVNIWREIEQAGAGVIDDDTQDGTDRLLQRWLALSTDQRQAMRERTLPCFLQHFELQRVTRQLEEALALAASSQRIEPTFCGRFWRTL
jgi:glycosyltransferase involved in cell wall biosynthesis